MLLAQLLYQAGQHSADFRTRFQHQDNLIFIDVMKPAGNDQVSFQLFEGTTGDRKVPEIFAKVHSPVPLRNVCWNRNRSSLDLAG